MNTFQKGDRVRHQKYGDGTVMAILLGNPAVRFDERHPDLLGVIAPDPTSGKYNKLLCTGFGCMMDPDQLTLLARPQTLIGAKDFTSGGRETFFTTDQMLQRMEKNGAFVMVDPDQVHDRKTLDFIADGLSKMTGTRVTIEAAPKFKKGDLVTYGPKMSTVWQIDSIHGDNVTARGTATGITCKLHASLLRPVTDDMLSDFVSKHWRSMLNSHVTRILEMAHAEKAKHEPKFKVGDIVVRGCDRECFYRVTSAGHGIYTVITLIGGTDYPGTKEYLLDKVTDQELDRFVSENWTKLLSCKSDRVREMALERHGCWLATLRPGNRIMADGKPAVYLAHGVDDTAMVEAIVDGKWETMLVKTSNLLPA